MRAQCWLPDGPNYRAASWRHGLAAAGLDVVDRIETPRAGDVLLLWNRHPRHENEAQRFERGGATVLIAENGLFGKLWRGSKWFTLTRGHCAGAGAWRDGGTARWDSWGVSLAPWRTGGREVVVLEQRGIGEPGVASPAGWAETVAAQLWGRVRQHPGAHQPVVSLEDDLARARCVVTWNSSAALLALLAGVPVFYDCRSWIGADAALPLSAWGAEPWCVDAARLSMFRRAAWATWTAEEVESGEAIGHALFGRWRG